jgi:hypothetical protein
MAHSVLLIRISSVMGVGERITFHTNTFLESHDDDENDDDDKPPPHSP